MTAEPVRDQLWAAPSPMPVGPVAFDGLFGWFSPGINRRGVILCGTLGYEQLLAHRMWRELAGRIAATGCACLRFDYPGEGDSADLGTGRLSDLTGAIRRAVRYMREQAGVEELVLIGLRLGGTFAALVAEEEAIDRLCLMSPFPSGRAYLREMTLQSRTLDRMADGSPIPHEPGSPIVGGFRLPPGLVDDLSGVNLARTGLPARHVLLMGADPSALAARYEGLGAAVETAPFPGLAQVVGQALSGEIPHEDLAAVARFVADGARPRPDALRPPPAPARISGEGWVEEPVSFGSGLFAILCRPPERRLGRPSVLFVNSGLNPRAGYGRQSTALARRLAALGVSTMRMDQRGVGDSPDRPDGTSPLYALDAVEELRAALDRLESEGPGPIIVVGSCSGAHLAFHAARRDPRIAEVILLNLYAFVWEHSEDVETVLRNRNRSVAPYAAMIKRGATWRRLMRGEIHVASIARALARTATARVRQRATLASRSLLGRSVAGQIAGIRRRGGRVRLVYSRDDFGIGELHAHLGHSPKRLARRLGRPVAILDGVDHNMSTLGAQERVYDILRDAIATLDRSGSR